MKYDVVMAVRPAEKIEKLRLIEQSIKEALKDTSTADIYFQAEMKPYSIESMHELSAEEKESTISEINKAIDTIGSKLYVRCIRLDLKEKK